MCIYVFYRSIRPPSVRNHLNASRTHCLQPTEVDLACWTTGTVGVTCKPTTESILTDPLCTSISASKTDPSCDAFRRRTLVRECTARCSKSQMAFEYNRSVHSQPNKLKVVYVRLLHVAPLIRIVIVSLLFKQHRDASRHRADEATSILDPGVQSRNGREGVDNMRAFGLVGALMFGASEFRRRSWTDSSRGWIQTENPESVTPWRSITSRLLS